MEENNVENQHQESHKKLTPIICPHCKSKNLAFITEYHKSICARIFFILALIITLIVSISSLKNFNDKSIGVIFISAIPTIALGIYITAVESKTHIQCICKDCGFDWLKN